MRSRRTRTDPVQESNDAIVGAIDAHVHVGPPYQRVEEYVDTMDRLGISHAVLVQRIDSTDNSYLASSYQKYCGRFTCVAVLDPRSPDRLSALNELLESHAFTGVRTTAGDLSELWSERDQKVWWECLDRHGAVLSVRGPFDEHTLTVVQALAHGYGTIKVKVEHLGGIDFKNRRRAKGLVESMLRLSEQPNVFLMWSGFWHNCRDLYPYRSVWRAAAATYQEFGAERICWSGDWNFMGGIAEEYARQADLVRSFFKVESALDQRRILTGTAAVLHGQEWV